MLALHTRCRTLVLPAVVLIVSLSALSLLAADTKKSRAKSAKAADSAKADEKSKDEKGKDDAAADRYALPEGDSAALLKFIMELSRFRPTTREEYVAHKEKAADAVRAAAEKILEIEKDKDSDAYKTASALLMKSKLSALAKATPQEQSAALEKIQKSYSDNPVGAQEVQLAMSAANELEFGGNPELAAQIYALFGELGTKSKDEKVIKISGMLTGAARRLSLLGKPVEIKGTTLEGEPFDWQSYRGKVVLIDFWATWCGPCRQEIPNVRKNYDAYHEKGFDVVGISLDDDRDALDKFLEKEGTPWVTLHEKNASANPLASYYGVFGIPTVFLVDKQGNAVSTNARGPELGRLLKELLGEPVKKPESKDSKKDASDDDAVEAKSEK